MQKLLLVLFFFCTQQLFAQRGYLYIKKKGYKKVRTYAEGSAIHFQTRDGRTAAGYIALVKKDSLLVNNSWYRAGEISKIIIRGKVDGAIGTLLWTTGGVALSTAGMTLAEWASFKKSLGYSAAIGYGNFLIQYLPSFIKRKKYNIGKKFTVQTLDLHF
jgi:hypothetical protein